MSLKEALTQIDKTFGKGSITTLGSKETLSVPAISTGVLSLDRAIGVGGFPRGRIIEIAGMESSGKTTIALQTIAEAQKAGGKAAYIDAEHSLDVDYARALGVKVDDLLLSQPDWGEQGLEIADVLVRSGEVDIIVIDSVAALTPRAEIDGEMGQANMALQARMMSQAMRKLTAVAAKSNTVLIFINQYRSKVGVFYGAAEVTTGGNALKFYASVRLDIRRIETLKKGDEQIGSRTRIKVIKNKVSTPFKSTEVDILYGRGVSKEGDILDLATSMGIVSRSGSWYTMNSEKLGQGRDNVIEGLTLNPDLLSRIKALVQEEK